MAENRNQDTNFGSTGGAVITEDESKVKMSKREAYKQMNWWKNGDRSQG